MLLFILLADRKEWERNLSVRNDGDCRRRKKVSKLTFVRFGCGCRPEEPVGVALSRQDRDAAHTRQGVLGVGVLDELLWAEDENIPAPGYALGCMADDDFLATGCPMGFLQAGGHVLRPQSVWPGRHRSVVVVVGLD
jgi:hypothetical protein